MVFEDFRRVVIPTRVLLASLVAAIVLTACNSSGRSVPEILVNGDHCSYEGRSEIPAGEVTTVLQLRSLGHNAVAVLALDEGHAYTEVVDYYAGQTEPVPPTPAWADQVVFFELLQEGGEGKGDSQTVVMTPGTYAVVCIDFRRSAANGPQAAPIAEVTVTNE